jgi:hypothetical protein
VIAGRVVTDEATPQPVRRARVFVQSVESEVSRWTMTDAAGRYSINDLPEGRYTVSVTKPGFVRTVFGAKRFDRPGTPVGLASGQRADASMRMLRGAVITGVVRDENGMPAPNVGVRAMQFRTQNGERTLANVASSGNAPSDQTDDRGVYRLFGLAPGDFVISATPRDGGRGNLKQMTDDQLRAAQQALRPNTGPLGAASSPAAPPADAPTVGFTPMYYPGAMLPIDAALVTIGAGEEREGVDVHLRLVRTAKIAGKVITPEGVAPQDVQNRGRERHGIRHDQQRAGHGGRHLLLQWHRAWRVHDLGPRWHAPAWTTWGGRWRWWWQHRRCRDLHWRRPGANSDGGRRRRRDDSLGERRRRGGRAEHRRRHARVA